MKILFIHDYAAPLGGAEVLTLDLCDELRARGHDVRLFASRADATRAEYSRNAQYTCVGTTSSFRTMLQCANPDAAMTLRHVLREFRPDVVHVKMFLTQLSPLILPLLHNIPVLYHAVWYRAVCPLGTRLLPDGKICNVRAGMACLQNGCIPARDFPLHMMQRKMLWRWKDAFNLVIANSHCTREKLIEGDFFSPEKIRVIWNGAPASDAQSSLEQTPLVVFSGRLVWEKGVEVLLRAFERVTRSTLDARLIVCGDGTERARLQGLARTLKIENRVEFLGRLSRAESEGIAARSWVQAVPSLWDEPFGNVVAEAMMRGTAPLASNSGGPRELIEDGVTGVLAPPGDVDTWTRALEDLLNDRARCQRLGENARAFAHENLSLRKCADEFDSLYRDLISSASSSTS